MRDRLLAMETLGYGITTPSTAKANLSRPLTTITDTSPKPPLRTRDPLNRHLNYGEFHEFSRCRIQYAGHQVERQPEEMKGAGGSISSPALAQLSLTQHPRHRLADLRRRLHHRNPRLRHRLHLLRSRSLTARDDRTRMTHPPPRRSRLPRDKSNYRLLHMLLDVLRRSLFRRAADLPDHDDRLSLRILIQQLQRIDMGRPNNRVAPNPNRRRLPNPARRQLVHRLIGQRSRLRDNPHRAFLVNPPRHNANLSLARRDHTRTVWSNQPRPLAI